MSAISRWLTTRRFNRMARSVETWVNNEMDQWEKFKFVDACGNTVYVTVSLYDMYPETFDEAFPDVSATKQ